MASNKGNCYICAKEYTKAGMSKHLVSHYNDDINGEKQECITVKVEDRSGLYWLYLDISAKSNLKTLDDFLRKIWLECCGHLSAFYYKGYDEAAMSTPIAFIPVGATLSYEYDFGSTTDLKIKFLSRSFRKKQRNAVRLLARNVPYEFECNKCGKMADYIDQELIWRSDNPFVCEECSEKYDGCFLPVVNSPRMGVCGYCGDFDVYEFDAGKLESD